MSNTDIELIDFFESVEYFLSLEFRNKWRFKYPSNLIILFQTRLLAALENHRQVKKSTIVNYIASKGSYEKPLIGTFLYDTNAVEELHPVLLDG